MNKTSPRTQSLSIIYFKMEDICEELDHLTVKCFDSLECLQEKREYLNASIRGGHLHLSKARHSMGNKSVGALQYSHKMDRALYHVVVYLGHFTEQFENAVATFEMEKTLSRRGKGTSKADYSEKEEEENIVKEETSKFRCFEQCMKQVE